MRFRRFYLFKYKIDSFFENLDKFKLNFASSSEQKPSFFSNLLGKIYRKFKYQGESWRIRKFERQKEVTNISIIFQIWKISFKTFLILLFIFLICHFFDIYIDFYFTHFGLFKTLKADSIISSLGVLAGCISAVLGLIFALYAVGFQLATEKYSEIVTKYIENERLGNWFFMLLILTDLFIIATLFKIQFSNQIPYFSLIIIAFLVFSSLFSLIIFKQHYITSIKPESIFLRLLSEIDSCVIVVSDIKSSSYKSWSIVKHQQNKVRQLLSIVKALFEDLIRAKNWQDAKHGILISGGILQHYLQKKRYIDRKRGLWFPPKHERVYSNNLSMYDLKFAYEIQGKGPLHIQTPYFNWLEDNITIFLRQIKNIISEKYNSSLMTVLIEVYKIILVGDVYEDKYGRFTQPSKGAFQSQEFESFEILLEDFIDLFNFIDCSDNSNETNYLNSFFSIISTITEGFDWDIFYKYIEYLKVLNINKIINSDMPALFRKTLIDYCNRLEIEKTVNNKIITPEEWIRQELENELKENESKLIENYIKKCSNHINKVVKICYEKNQKEVLLNFIGIQWVLIQQLFNKKCYKLAEDISEVANKNTPFILEVGDIGLVNKVDIRQQIEYILFPSIIAGNKIIFKNSLKAFFVTHLLLKPTKLEDMTDLLKSQIWFRVPLIIGSMCYIISELNQDEYFLTECKHQLVSLLLRKELLIEILKSVLKQPLELIESEITHYFHWYKQFYFKIENIPKKYDSISGSMAIHEIADHPSKFIQENSRDMLYQFLEENSKKEFVNWLEESLNKDV